MIVLLTTVSLFGPANSAIAQVSNSPTSTPLQTPTIDPSASPTPSLSFDPSTVPLPNLSIQETEKGITCAMAPNPSSLDQSGVTGTHWRLTQQGNGSSQILDEFDLAIGVQSNGDSIVTQQKNGATAAVLTSTGVIDYGYILLSQIKGNFYQCSVAFKVKAGTGRYISVTQESTFSTLNFVKVVEPSPTSSIKSTVKKKSPVSIACVRGKSVKVVKAVNPKCPKGYKRK